MSEGFSYVFVNVCECMVGIYVCMHACIYACVYTYTYTYIHIFIDGGRNKYINGEFIVGTVSICVWLSIYVKVCICLHMHWW